MNLDEQGLDFAELAGDVSAIGSHDVVDGSTQETVPVRTAILLRSSCGLRDGFGDDVDFGVASFLGGGVESSGSSGSSALPSADADPAEAGAFLAVFLAAGRFMILEIPPWLLHSRRSA